MPILLWSKESQQIAETCLVWMKLMPATRSVVASVGVVLRIRFHLSVLLNMMTSRIFALMGLN
jgi:hypothetical protein